MENKGISGDANGRISYWKFSRLTFAIKLFWMTSLIGGAHFLFSLWMIQCWDRANNLESSRRGYIAIVLAVEHRLFVP
jgi:hypothetical protein